MDDSVLRNPSLGKFYTEVFRISVPVELRLVETSDSLGTLETLDATIYIRGPADDPKEVKIELISEVDLFFHYTHKRNVDTFRDIQQSHKLLIKLKDYPKLMENLLNKVKTTPTQFLAVFYMDRQGGARFDIIQNISYKFMELVSCEFVVSSNDLVRNCLTYRFELQRRMMQETENQIQQLEEIIKHRATGLLPVIKKKLK
jgi:hypothetical protein